MLVGPHPQRLTDHWVKLLLGAGPRLTEVHVDLAQRERLAQRVGRADVAHVDDHDPARGWVPVTRAVEERDAIEPVHVQRRHQDRHRRGVFGEARQLAEAVIRGVCDHDLEVAAVAPAEYGAEGGP